MAQFKNRPVYTPASKIQSALYSIGKEYMYAETLEEYYRERYGAIKNFHGFMEIHPEKSHQLIKEYLEKEEE